MNGAPGTTGAPDSDAKSGSAAQAALWISLAGACVLAATTFLVVRAVWRRRPPDQTTERIQALIDEANRLIRTLEEKK
jgi:membrane protein implicated in regulation of membrane protease activity